MKIRAQFVTDALSAWVQIKDQDMTIGLGNLKQTDLTIDGTIEDLFVKAKHPEKLLLKGTANKLHQFMSAFAI